MNQHERVVRAIEFGNPDSIPVWNMNADQTEGDVLWYDLRCYEDAVQAEPQSGTSLFRGHLSEWGYTWRILDGDGTLGQPTEPVIKTWDDFESFRPPTMNLAQRFKNLDAFNREAQGYYKLPMLIVNGFTNYTFLRGFENSLFDFATRDERAFELLRMIFEFEKEVMTHCAEAGFHGFHLGDDWGMQKSLMISAKMWEEIFAPFYRDQIEHAHRLNLHIWFHSCGNFTDIIPQLHELGVDVINIAQPNVVTIEKFNKQLSGRQCFLMPISYQTTSISGTKEDIHQEAQRMYDLLGDKTGGFIGYVEEYSCMGMSDENFQECKRAFQAIQR